jgi:hypothetical protein
LACNGGSGGSPLLALVDFFCNPLRIARFACEVVWGGPDLDLDLDLFEFFDLDFGFKLGRFDFDFDFGFRSSGGNIVFDKLPVTQKNKNKQFERRYGLQSMRKIKKQEKNKSDARIAQLGFTHNFFQYIG